MKNSLFVLFVLAQPSAEDEGAIRRLIDKGVTVSIDIIDAKPTVVGLDFRRVRSNHAKWANDGLADEIAVFPKLKSLSVRATGLTNVGAKKISKLYELEHLDFTGTKVTDECLAELLRIRNLRSLELEAIPISDKGMEFLCHFLGHRLERLNLAESGVMDKHLEIIGRLKKLTELDISENEITDRNICELARLPKLRTLRVSSLNLRGHSFDCLAKCTDLSEVSLGDSPITDEGIKSIGKIQSLRTLHMQGNMLSEAGLCNLNAGLVQLNCMSLDAGDKALAGLVRQCKKLQCLGLSFSQITHHGLNQLSQLSELRQLEIAHIPLDKAGIAEISKIKTLTRLYVVKTGVSDMDVHMLCKSDLKIESFCLSNNSIGDGTCKMLADMTTLVDLDLSSTKVTDMGILDLAQSKSLKRLSLANTSITDRTIAGLAGSNLEYLNVELTNITESSFENLPRLRHLRKLLIPGRLHNSIHLMKLRKEIPQCNIM